MQWNRDGFLTPAGPEEWLARSSANFTRQCPFSPASPNEDRIAAERFGDAGVVDPKVGRFVAAYVGHVAEQERRAEGSSGGLVSWVAAELLRTGAVDGVAHVKPADPDREGRLFVYGISRTEDEVRAGAKSRYYPIELSQVLREIRRVPGRYAIVGVPCFIKAVHLLRRLDPIVAERVTHTLGLFCGHMKSAHMVESFAWQLGTEIGNVRALDYRSKDHGRPANWYRAKLGLRNGESTAGDWWNFADGDWGAGFLQNPACDYCDDVVAETADIAFGDAWVEPHASDGRGTNVVVVRTPELAKMLDQAVADGRLELNPVGADFIVETQAAGFRHRREGLAWRLARKRRRGVDPLKRVAASANLPLRRHLIYRMRRGITRWSHPMMRVARALHAPFLYTCWARGVLRLYQAVAWSRGGLGRFFDRVLPQSPR